MKIRYGAEDDLQKIGNVYEKSWKYAYKNIIPQSYLDGISYSAWTDNIIKNGRNNIVMTENDVIIGTVSFGRSRWEQYDNYGEIISLYLLPEYIGKGSGKALLDRAIKELKSLGFQHVLLWVLEDNARARSFYEKHGFTLSKEYKKENIGGKELKEVMYSYQIK